MSPPEIAAAPGHPPFGLTFVPTLRPHHADTDETLPGYLVDLRPGEDDNTPAVLDIVAREAAGRRAVLEIGVSLYDEDKSFTPLLVRGKAPGGVYLGVDTARRDPSVFGPGAHFLRVSSADQGAVRARLRGLGVDRLDLLVIDGCHSVAGCLNDWRYADLVAPGGVVLIHDSNSHPGPIAVVAAIDRDVFFVEEPLKREVDYGIAVCRRLR